MSAVAAKALMSDSLSVGFDFGQTHFALFGLAERFALDMQLLDEQYRFLQSKWHPDRFAVADESARMRSMMAATRINEAYQLLKRPVDRARYLLNLKGVDTQEETNTAMPAEFLMAQMEWREQLADARASMNVSALESLAGEIRGESEQLHQQLAQAIDVKFDLALAALLVRKLRFLDKLNQEIGDAIEAALF